jgi:hypothetical protein
LVGSLPFVTPDGGDLPRRNFLSLTAKSSAALFCFRLASSVGAPFLLSNLVAAHNDIEATTLRRVRPTDKAALSGEVGGAATSDARQAHFLNFGADAAQPVFICLAEVSLKKYCRGQTWLSD